MEIDGVVDRLFLAMERFGLAPPHPPADLGVLQEVVDEIAPLRLPLDALRLLERIDLQSVGLPLYPEHCDLASGLRTWKRHRETLRGMVPAVLFPLCSAGHMFFLLELDDPEGRGGGAVFYWGYGGFPFTLVHYNVTDWWDTIVTVLEQSSLEAIDSPRGAWRQSLGEDYMRLVSTRMEQALPHPVYGRPTLDPGPTHHYGYTIFLEEDPSTWPAHWRSLSGLDDAALLPRGATHTIMELVRTAQQVSQQGPTSDQVRATIAGQIVGLSGSSAGAQAIVNDGTGQLVVWCPSDVIILGPRIRQRCEFDVSLRFNAAAQETADQRASA